MKSLVCELDGGARKMAAALTEAEYFARFSELSEKQALHLRLLTEELLGMAAGVLELHSGSIWIEQEDLHFKLHLTAHSEVGKQAKKQLLDASSSGENELHKGISGKIRQAMDWLLSGSTGERAVPMGMCGGMSTTPVMMDALAMEWSLESYRRSVARDEKAQAWDELEKSVLGKLADDVRVGVQSDRIEITIEKSFA